MSRPAVLRMARRLTVPFERGSDSLVLTLSTSNAGTADVAQYDFREHLARFDRQPDPRYVLVAKRDVPVATQVKVEFQVPGGAGPVTHNVLQTVGKDVLAGTSFLLDLSPHDRPELRIRRLLISPPPADALPADWWDVIALLGNISKLLWVMGHEADHLYRQLEIVRGQRQLSNAIGRGLDLLGFDLGVPRFPELPHSFDPDTIALYHLDDDPGAVPEVANIAGQYTAPAAAKHHGANTGGFAQAGAAGRFNQGFAFRNPSAEIIIPNHADFDAGPADSLTVECFAKPDAGGAEGHVLSKHSDPANAAQSGWALSIGEFGRGVPINCRLLLSDGAAQVALFADETLETARFTHIAGTVDRAAQQASLYINGVLHATAAIATLGSLTNAEPIRIGRTGGVPFTGILDEVRISRVARTRFHTVLGESDESYRRRLRIFERWTLPTPADLQRILNEACGPISGDTTPLVVKDENAPLVLGSRLVNIVPVELDARESIDSLGRHRVKEAAVNGTPSEDDLFDPIYLIIHNDPRAVYDPLPPRILQPGEPAPGTAKMHRLTGRVLTALLDLLASEGVAAGGLHVQSAFDPRESDLRAVGRGLLLRHDAVALGRLAALAHRAGFSFVVRPAALNSVYVSVPRADFLQVNVIAGGTATGADGLDLRIGETLNLTVHPSLPADTAYEWKTIACGAGRAVFDTRTDRPTVVMRAVLPGRITVKVEAFRRHRLVSATRVFTAGLVNLADNESIGADGELGVTEAVAGTRDSFFHDAYLVTHNHPQVTYGNVQTRRLHPTTARRLDRLMDLTSPLGAGGRVNIQQAWVPGAPDLRAIGRALTIRPVVPASLPVERLGALAHAAGFTFVRRQGAQILLRQADGELLTIPAQPDTRDVAEGTSQVLAVTPRAGPSAIALAPAAAVVANRDTDTITEVDRATNEIRRTIKVGWAPVDIAITNDGLRVYTADSKGDTISAVTLATGAVTPVAAPAGPSAVVHHATATQIYVTAATANRVAAFDSTTMAPLGNVAVPAVPVAAAVTPATDELWIASSTARLLTVLTATTLASLSTILLPDEPARIAIAPDGARAYVTIPGAGLIRVIDVVAKTVLGQFATGGAPFAVAIAPDGSRLYVTNRETGQERVQILEPQAPAPFLIDRGSVRVRKGPIDVVAAANAAYVANQESDLVSVVELAPPPARVARNWRLGTGLGEQLTWVVRPEIQARAQLSTSTGPVCRLTAVSSGGLLVRAVSSNRRAPYTFEVRLKPALEAAASIITKAQYDLIMNALNTFHPIGVEVITEAVRERVIEIREGLLSAFPDYTYPHFHVRGLPRARHLREGQRS